MCYAFSGKMFGLLFGSVRRRIFIGYKYGSLFPPFFCIHATSTTSYVLHIILENCVNSRLVFFFASLSNNWNLTPEKCVHTFTKKKPTCIRRNQRHWWCTVRFRRVKKQSGNRRKLWRALENMHIDESMLSHPLLIFSLFLFLSLILSCALSLFLSRLHSPADRCNIRYVLNVCWFNGPVFTIPHLILLTTFLASIFHLHRLFPTFCCCWLLVTLQLCEEQQNTCVWMNKKCHQNTFWRVPALTGLHAVYM